MTPLVSAARPPGLRDIHARSVVCLRPAFVMVLTMANILRVIVLCCCLPLGGASADRGAPEAADRTDDSLYCGPDCVYLLARFRGTKLSYPDILSDVTVTDKGVSMADLKRCVKKRLHVEMQGYRLGYRQLRRRFTPMAIARLAAPAEPAGLMLAHWVLLFSVDEEGVNFITPPHGKSYLSRENFNRVWTGDVLLEARAGFPFGATALLGALVILAGLLLPAHRRTERRVSP